MIGVYMKKRMSIIIYGILWLLVCLVLSYAAKTEPASFGQIDKGNLKEFNSQWTYVHGDEHERIDLPESVGSTGGSETVIYKNLPTEIKANDCLFTSTSHMTMQAYINGKLIYEYGKEREHFFSVPANAFHIIPLEPIYAGQEIKLILSSDVSRYMGQLNAIQYGDQGSFLLNYARDNAFSLLSCTLTFGLAIFLFVVWIAIRNIVRQNGLLYLSLFSFNMFMWALTETYIPQFFVGHALTFNVLAFESLLLLPIPLLLLLKENSSVAMRKTANMLLGTTIGAFLACNMLFVGNVMDLSESVWITHLNLVAGSIWLLVVTLTENERQRKLSGGIEGKNTASTWGFVFMTATIIIDVATYYIFAQASSYNFVKVGLVMYVLTFAIDSVRSGFKLVMLGEKAAKYEDLAYRDMLTGVFNRTAYKEAMQKLDEDPALRAGTAVVILDINNLKMVNDAMGHAVGDRYILSNVDLMRKHFENIGKIYRIGGDEFVILISQEDEDQFRWALHKMEQDVDSDGVSNFAFGYAYFETEDGSIQNTARRADALMYQKKVKQKQHR